MQRFLFPVLLAFALAVPALNAQVGGVGVPPPVSIQPGQEKQPARPSQQVPELPKGSVKGHVYSLDTGQPLKRASLTLRSSRRRDEPLMTMTDALGTFEFKNVEPDTYYLSCARTGYMQTNYGQKSPMLPPTPLSVRPGQDLKDIDFQLIRGGVISGTVLDEDGEPASRVQIQALARYYGRGRVQYIPRGGVSTDDRGQYRMFGLPPGRYYVQASYNAQAFGQPAGPTSYAPILYPNVLSLKDALRIEVINGNEVSQVDFRLRPVPAYSASGTVIDQETDRPLAEGFISVIAADPQSGYFRSGAGSPIRAGGRFKVSGLLPGSYRLMVNLPNRSGGMGRVITKPLEMPAADVTDIVIAFGPAVTVKGKVLADGGTLPSPLRVLLAPAGSMGMIGPGSGNATANADGSFEMQNVQPGDYTVSVYGGGGEPSGTSFFVREVRVGGQDVLEKGLTITDGASPEIEVVLDFAGGSIAGHLLNDKDEPVSTPVVLIVADLQKRASDRYFKAGHTDQLGQFTLRGVIPGDYLLLAWPDGEAQRAQDPELFAQLEKYATRVHVEKNGNVTQDLKLLADVTRIVQADQ